ncbi:LysR family transcriptional regulator [Paraburkholderia phenoliruptrix]|uniref:HTH-type transcriptional regulator DmlR n=2 Tax=Paraburkholderia phenoliruptrix TaxID=252970 RepID=A0A6J5KF67_9BURK|nr:LysR family transcriptional regulator [Paraburkholderia phenoliruptrix]AFT90001.1 putative HTH-type transcriptional regulator [Paraburkholderia phenoliruptrix BR3459a]CAB4052468.1 HTH-type transcriptional regulator DmlR [Paraburkholderia phenoliruptrix]
MNHVYAMRVFVQAAEARSFRSAAKQLNVSTALVTRSVANLEAHLGLRLMDRTTRTVSLTEAGKHYLEGCRPILEELDRLDASVSTEQREITGVLRILATDALSPRAMTALIDGFRRCYPQVHVQLTLTDREVEQFEEGYDAGLLIASPSTDVDCIQLPLVTQNLVPCAAPSYLSTCGDPHEPAQLEAHSCIAMTTAEEYGPTVWRFIDVDGAPQSVTFKPSYAANSRLLVRLAAIAGMGIALLPESLVAEDLAKGILKRIIPGYRVGGSTTQVWLFYPRRRFLPPVTCSFITYMLEHAGREASTLPANGALARARPKHSTSASEDGGDLAMSG